MYAVIKTGGKQYRAAIGQKLKIEQIPAEVGSEIAVNDVLMIVDDTTIIGTPLIDNASVTATVIGQGRHPKVKVFKMRRRKHYQKRQGHRQNYTEIEIKAINA